MTNGRSVHKIPEAAHGLARKMYDRIRALCDERSKLIDQYNVERLALEAKYVDLCQPVLEQINATKISVSKEICEACGVPFDPQAGYAVDVSYLPDFNVAFLQVQARVDGERFDGQEGDTPANGALLN